MLFVHNYPGVDYAQKLNNCMNDDRSDVVGLQAVKRAKAEFERDHPSCPACGTRQDNSVMHKCKRCQHALFGRGN